MEVWVNDKIVFTEKRAYDLSPSKPVIVKSEASLVDVKSFVVVADPTEDRTPKKPESTPRISPEVLAAWTKAGADVFWTAKNRFPVPEFRNIAEEGDMPLFSFLARPKEGWEKLPTVKGPFVLNFGGKVGDADIRGLSNHQQVQDLYLPSTAVTDEGLMEVASLKQLQALILSDTRVTDRGLKHLASLNQLRHLDLSRTQVTDDGLKHLAPLTQLRDLFLYKTDVTDAGLKHLVSLRQLQVLNLRETEVTDEGVKQLQRALPKAGIMGAVRVRRVN
jgi:hypothetical protein